MPVALVNLRAAVYRRGKRSIDQTYLLRTQAHGATEIGFLAATFAFSGVGFPFGNQCDDRMWCTAHELGAMSALE